MNDISFEEENLLRNVIYSWTCPYCVKTSLDSETTKTLSLYIREKKLPVHGRNRIDTTFDHIRHTENEISQSK